MKTDQEIVVGTIFRLGPHRLAHGDARDAELVKRLMGPNQIDLLLTDVPYGVAYAKSKRGLTKLASPDDIAGDHIQSDDKYRTFTSSWLGTTSPHLAKPNAVYIFSGDKMIFALREGMLEAGFKLAQVLIWVKQQPVIGRLDYQPQHELICYGWSGTHRFRKAKDRSILFHPRPHRSPYHPTQKPIGLLRQLILNSTKIGGVVYDPFCGSGSTLLAADQTKRRCYAIELSLKHCRTIISRYERLTGQKAEVVDE